ncbi:septum formation protein [Rubricella aquisinus]|uniref:Nucleoside triphosphate pyrophosphatase n=1 Tax=Rubricella aquisinus TaxID=2028108 RepID=A0A840WH87_9RHOB|nr:septum formation protein [Rubricella aquisinus]
MTQPVILASGSKIRAESLRNAGVTFEVDVPRVDEASIKAAMLAEEAPPRDIADKLAELKSLRISARHPEALTLGCDQVLVHKGRLFDKPANRAEAAEHLRHLNGSSHELLSAAVISEAGRPVWRHIGRAQLVMRPFSDAFLEDYLDAEGDEILHCVGAYRLEGRGAQLFSRVQGDYFSVLGLPLLEVLGFLRARKVLIE